MLQDNIVVSKARLKLAQMFQLHCLKMPGTNHPLTNIISQKETSRMNLVTGNSSYI